MIGRNPLRVETSALLFVAVASLFVWLLLPAKSAAQDAGPAVVLELKGPLGPATARYLVRGIEAAAEDRAPLVVIEMDTPGGLDSSMRDVIRAILASPVPVATYVSPSGARAASAGAYILIASHVAAMAPATNVGAATPVTLGGGGLPFGGENEKPEDQPSAAEKPAAPRTPSEAKAVNDAVAYIRSLADLRDRNADWAESAVREAASLSARAAVEADVADFVVADLAALLERADGMTVTVGDAPLKLATRGVAIERAPPDWRTQFLAVITDPNVALILMMIGIYGIVFELLNPGSVLPGTIGGISLLLGLYALAVLPIDYAGLGLILLGLALMAAEAFAPSFGILGIGGAAAFALGAAILVETDVPGFGVSYPVIGALAIVSLGFSLIVLGALFRSRRFRIATGREEMIGMRAEVQDWADGHGHVFVRGERWQAASSAPIAPGETVRIRQVDGLLLEVEPDKAAKE
jgi:membrane-bound serine protease (ClpP class)